MIPDSELLRYCRMPVLNRARSVAFSRSERMHDLTYARDGSRVTLSATVTAGTAGVAPYDSCAVLDVQAGTLCGAHCTCPAYGLYDGICKHVAALVLRFNRAPGQFAGYQHRRFEGTSASLAEFMRAADARRADAASLRARRLAGDGPQEPPAGSVRLELTLEPGFSGWTGRFKVAGPGGSYVLKDVGSFVASMRAGERVAYGKKLAFTHVPSALDERSRGVLDLLDRLCAALEKADAGAPSGYGRVFGAGARTSPLPGRDVDLSDEEVAELLGLYRDADFEVTLERDGARQTLPAHVVDGDPDPGISVERFDREGCSGYLLRRRAQPLRIVAGRDVTYAQADNLFYRCSARFSAARDLLRAVFDEPSPELYVDDADRDLFCRTVLPLLGTDVRATVPPELEAARPVACRLAFYLDRAGGVVTCDVVACYGARHVPLAGSAHAAPASATGEGSASAQVPAASGETDVPGGTTAPAASGATGEETASALAPEATATASGASPLPQRDDAAERLGLELAGRYLTLDEGVPSAPARLSTRDADAVGRLLTEGLAAFRGAGDVFTTPAFDGIVAPRPPQVRVGLSVQSGLVELSTIADEVPPSEVSAVLSSYRRKKRFHRLKDGTFLDLSQADLGELDRVSSELGLTAAQLNAGHAELPGYHAFRLDGLVDERDKDASFSAYLRDFREVDPSRYEVPPAIARTLRPYQAEGFRWLCTVAARGFGGILADEMGLGKSVQLIAYLLAAREEAREVGPSLVVCPASLVYNWQAEFERFAPQMRVGVVAGTPEERARVRGRAAWAGRGTRRPGAYEVLVTSYDLLRRDADAYAGKPFFCEVLDEAQYVKNHATKAARAVRAVEARHRFALTGTPIENRLSELWSIFDFLMPGFLGSYQRFQERFEQPALDGDEGAAGALRSLVSPFVLRRLKADVLRDLPEKLENVVYVHLEGDQRRLYAAEEQRMRQSLAGTGDEAFRTGKLQVLAELTRLRELCCDPRLLYEDAPDASAKLEAIEELVESCRDSGQKSLVFSQFTSFLDLIAERLRQRGVAFYTITGATPKRRRLELVNAFNADGTPTFLISLKAGNTGLNLTGASAVIHADPWWNAAAQSQATDRAHRIGQTRAVSVYQVVAKDTVEERILRLQQAKSELAERFAGGVEGAGGVAALTRDDLLGLLG